MLFVSGLVYVFYCHTFWFSKIGTKLQIIRISKVHIFWEGHKILRNLHLTLSYVVPVKSFVAFSEYMNFKGGFFPEHTLMYFIRAIFDEQTLETKYALGISHI